MGLSSSSEQLKMVPTSTEEIALKTTGDTTTSMVTGHTPHLHTVSALDYCIFLESCDILV